MTQMSQTFLSALDLADAQIAALEPDQWNQQSPCSEWDARGVVVHVTGTVGKVVEMLGDKGAYDPMPAGGTHPSTPEATGQAWTRQVEAARAAVACADLSREVDSPLGRVPAARGLAMPTADLAVHAWDIAAAAGRRLDLPAPLLAFVQGIIGAVPAHARASFFDAPVPVTDDASATERLMAELGRRRP